MKTLLQTNSYGSQPDPPWWLGISWAGVNDEDRRCTGDAGGEGQQPAAGWRKCGMLVPTQCRSNVQCWLAPCHQSHYLQKRHPCFGVAETGARAWPLLQAQEENNLVAQKFKGTQLWRVIGLLPGQKTQWALRLHFCTCWCRMQTLFDRGWLDQEECLADYGGGGSGNSRGQITLHAWNNIKVSAFHPLTVLYIRRCFFFTLGCFDSILLLGAHWVADQDLWWRVLSSRRLSGVTGRDVRCSFWLQDAISHHNTHGSHIAIRDWNMYLLIYRRSLSRQM